MRCLVMYVLVTVTEGASDTVIPCLAHSIAVVND